jgi:histidyl-tRNA synthetase
MSQISNLPPKGTSDWFPEEYKKRKYIFDAWRKVCLAFGYEEYLTPIIESAEVYRAKSGEDVGGKELMVMVDRAGRELAIRPEMTPSVTRMVSRIYESSTKPLRLFSIANFLRNEKPQKGRNREFWQLNCDIFGSNSIMADVEILQLAISIMLEFGATKEQFIVYYNDRRLIEALVTDFLKVDRSKVSEATRILDKFGKINNDDLILRLKNEIGAKIDNATILLDYLNLEEDAFEYVYQNYLKDNQGIKELMEISSKLEVLGLKDFIKYNPSMVRGFDYYDGMVFEVYDRKDYLKRKGEIKTEESFRSLFGGGRYNGLAGIFGGQSFPAVGFAPGDETTKLFLEEYNLFKDLSDNYKTYYLPILEDKFASKIFDLAATLRKSESNIVRVGLEVQKIGKALDYSNKTKVDYVVVLGENEFEKGIYLLKDMKSGSQVEIKL